MNGERVAWVDSLRGAAIVLMIGDHLLAQVQGGFAFGLRLTVTRLALPMFMACAAMVWRPRAAGATDRPWADRLRRPVRLASAAVVEAALLPVLGFHGVGVVGVFCVVSVLLWALGDRPLIWTGTVGMLGLLQCIYLPLDWGGYQPGLVLLWWCFALLARGEVETWGEWFHARASWLGWIGRRPLAWYCGHVVVLAALITAGWL